MESIEKWKSNSQINIRNWSKYEEMIKNAVNNFVEINSIKSLVREGSIRANLISLATLRRCIGSLEADNVEREALEAFCHVLDVSLSDLQEYRNLSKSLNKASDEKILYEVLSQFNYQQAVLAIQEKAKQNRRMKIYRISGNNLVNQNWLIRKIEHKINE